MSTIERIDTMFIDHYVSRLRPELLANGGPRRAGFHHPPGFLVLKQRGVGQGISVVIAKRDRDVYDRSACVAARVKDTLDGPEQILLAMMGGIPRISF